MLEQLNQSLAALVHGQQTMEARLTAIEQNRMTAGREAGSSTGAGLPGISGAGGTPLFAGPAAMAPAAVAKSTVLGTVGPPPPVRAGETHGQSISAPRFAGQGSGDAGGTTLNEVGNLNVEQLIQMVAAATASLKSSGEMSDGLLGDVSSSEIGARGASAYAAQEKRFETAPGKIWLDGRERARELLARREGEPTRFASVVQEFPWQTFNTAKRAFSVLAAIGDALENNNVELAKGRTMQGLRWLALSLDCPKDPLVAWRLNFLADPGGPRGRRWCSI
jgi:hypothetical protein